MTAALAILEESDEAALSLRAVARRAGVSANAPYRHYPDKDALLAALATHGFNELRVRLVDAQDSAPTGQELVCLAQSYVRYAVEHPALFRLMFNRPCDPSHPGVKAAGDAAYAVLSPHVVAGIPPELHEAHVTGWWSLVHGLASLALYGKLPRDDGAIQQVDELVRSTVTAMSRP
ncbi:TetR/AcrR family transcriptional regulator [Streptomyces mirabilis]|uniref:TetR/AcrR family transcriptional regulator n=1 Tax=Streptomyces mirabilis TaxID=68239 RepID=UPI00225830C0|nr:TetR/AcrR family transcriptional regulator [Streptomyces mirabilis]MCX4432162.1 TetR/AcrR family transcriptional regulator [Streptomyces mirabilis]